ncbi:MAG: glycosyltransferase family 9 protein [Candidatus Adiutrix sp.]|jgi:ADP-heptose:LPS heptosyltransferase|nr:glycosyltransferase family 9 protein [Candidatus Adiutrix sp.]
MAARILLIQLAKLGDFIQSTPLLANIRRQFPDSEISLAAENPLVLEAARLSPLVDETLPVKENEDLGRKEFQALFNLNSHLRAARLAAGIRAEKKYGPGLKNSELKFTPAQDFLMALMTVRRDLGRFNLADLWNCLLPGSGPAPLVWPRPGAEKAPRPGLFRIGFQLGARNHLRRWPLEDFARLGAELAGLGLNYRPVLIGSREERALGRRLEKLLDGRAPAPENLMGATGLAELGRVLAGLDFLVTADTGVMHLAAAAGAPVLGLFFGPAFGPETGPYGPGHLIYQALGPCAPCLENGPCRRRLCLERPDPVRAAALVAARLQGRPAPAADPSWPPGHRLWLSDLDDFGQTLRPLDRRPLDPDEILAQLITEAGRRVWRPEYRPAAARIQKILAACPAPAGDLNPDPLVISMLSRKAFPGRRDRRPTFLNDVRKLAADLGLKLALT